MVLGGVVGLPPHASTNDVSKLAPPLNVALTAVKSTWFQYLYELTYFSIPDYNFVYYCIQHACR
ncbi:hypothetical protein TELCIR_25316, partial [Teladorsagia circumcincta]